MTTAQWLLQYNWLVALTVAAGTISWAILILQAMFHDKRIALIGVFGSLLFSFTFLFPTVIPTAIKYTATVLCLVFFVWFVIKNINSKVVFIAAFAAILSSFSAYWLYQSYATAL